MQLLRFLAFGASYLFAGIYSLGLALYLADQLKPISGYVALVTVPDALFPYEVVTFFAIGAIFVMASVIEFRRTIRLAGGYWDSPAQQA